MVGVVPLDDIRRLPLFMANLKDDALTIRLARSMPSDQDSITDFCEHDASDPRPRYKRSTSLGVPALGAEVPDRTPVTMTDLSCRCQVTDQLPPPSAPTL